MARRPRDDAMEMRDVVGEENAALGSDNGDVVRDLSGISPEILGHRNSATVGAKKKTPDDKRADFNRLASGRVSRAIDALSSLLHLANTTTYDWTDEAEDKIFSTLRDKIDTVEAAFVAAKVPAEGKRKSSKQLSFRVDL